MFSPDSLLTGGSNILGGLINNWFAGERQESAQAFNSAQAQANRDWQQYMSNTAYQRGMDDMRKAGLNPILAYQKGPASSPSGNMASTTPAPVHDIGLGAAASSAMHHARLTQELQNMRETNANIRADTQKKEFEATNIVANTSKQIAETSKTTEEEKITVQHLQKAIADALEAKIKAGYMSSSAGQWLNVIGRGATDVGKIVAPITSAVGAARGAAQTNAIFQDRWP